MESIVQEKMFELRTEYLAQLTIKVNRFHQQWNEICNASGNLAVHPDFQRQIHNMRGTAGTYGFPEVGEVAGDIEELLKQQNIAGQIIDFVVQKKITDCLHKLTVVSRAFEVRGAGVARHAAAPFCDSTGAISTDQRPLLYLVDDDADYSRMMAERLVSHFKCHICPSKTAFTLAIAERIPDAVIMDMILPEGDLAGADAAMELASKHHVPVVFLSVRDDQESRLAAIRAGANGYFIKSDDLGRVQPLLDQLITHRPAQTYRVLLIDDDVELSEIYSIKLQSVGIEAEAINLPTNAMAKIAAFMPDMIVLDISMPIINGLELGALIRQYPAYNHIPIIYLSASTAKQVYLDALRLGGDDFLSKPVNPDYLAQLLLARLARVRVTRQGEQRLQDALHELGAIQEGLNRHSIISVADLAGRITYVNDKFVEISGYSRAELLGQNHRVVKSGLHSPEFYQTIWDTITSGKPWAGEITNRNKSGSLYTVLATIIPILDAYGLPQRYMSVRTDITQLRQLNAELEKERTRLALSLDATNTGLWEWNLTQNETLYDQNWCKLLGYSYPMQVSWPVLIHPDDHQETLKKLLAMLDDEAASYSSEHRKLNATGGWDWVLESGQVVEFDATGHAVRIMGTLQIINQRKEADARNQELREQLNQSIKMESVGHLTAGIAHDFNNILGAMLGYLELSQMLLSNGREIPVEKLARYLIMIQTSGVRAKELIAQMLTFSRLSPEGEKEELAPIVLLGPIIKEVVSLLRSSVPTTIDLNYRLEIDGLTARIQPVHLHQIILNLGINARDSIGKYGAIDITVSKGYIENQLCSACKKEFSGEFARISVKDSGSGIPDHLLTKIFDPFFTTKDVGKGTGMGLSVVHGLVHGLGGHIRVESSTDAGSSFTILLPQDALSDGVAEQVSVEAKAGDIKGVRIMVVDDERAMASMWFEFLSMYGAHVISYTNPLEALNAFAAHADSVDIVITDETMPGMSGMHLAANILTLRPGMPIILCTGFSEVATPEAAADIGIAAFFRKPMKMNELVAKIEALLKK